MHLEAVTFALAHLALGEVWSEKSRKCCWWKWKSLTTEVLFFFFFLWKERRNKSTIFSLFVMNKLSFQRSFKMDVEKWCIHAGVCSKNSCIIVCYWNKKEKLQKLTKLKIDQSIKKTCSDWPANYRAHNSNTLTCL